MIAAALFVLAAVGEGPVLVLAPEAPASGNCFWLAEVVADLVPADLKALGVPALTREEQLRAREALQIPPIAVTRATAVRLAESMGATGLIAGECTEDSNTLTLALRPLDLKLGAFGAPVTTSGSIDRAVELVHGAAWDLVKALGREPASLREDFASRRPRPSLEALKAYGAGLAARRPAVRLKLLRRAVTLAPTFEPARVALASALIEEGEFTAAHQALAKVPAASEFSRPARFAQARALLEVGRYQEAAEVYRLLAEALPSVGVLNNRALALLRAGARDPRPSELLRQALELDPAAEDVAFNRGWALLLEGDAAGAVSQLRALQERGPLDSRVRVALAWALRRAGRADEADEQWKSVGVIAPSWTALATPDLSRRFERILPAERPAVLPKTALTNAELIARLLARAERLTASADHEGALRELSQAAFLDPHRPRVHLLLARVHRARGDKDKAVNELRMVLWGAEDASLRVELASLLKDLGRDAEARDEAEKVLKLDPGNAAARRLIEGP
jgi:Flp pilus assembly protein TadD